MRAAPTRLALPLLVALVLALFAAPARAEEPSDHRYQTWLAGFAHGPIHRDLWLWTDLHLRTADTMEPAAILVRPGVSLRIRPSFFLTAGYAYTPSFVPQGEPHRFGDLQRTDEHRAWQQLLWAPSDPTTGVAGQIRTRFEQRYRPASSPDNGLRLRVLVRGQVPLVQSRRWIFVVWQEVFVALDDTTWGQVRGFDQNRVFTGVGWQVVPKVVRLELGYTNQWLPRPGPDPVNHIVALNAFFGWGS